ncbi:hypothetical protein VDS41_21700 [Xanthomonas campestris pv. campestris]|nr:hypothetical protein [Xanthomonas campestris pv. campestris]
MLKRQMPKGAKEIWVTVALNVPASFEEIVVARDPRKALFELPGCFHEV